MKSGHGRFFVVGVLCEGSLRTRNCSAMDIHYSSHIRCRREGQDNVGSCRTPLPQHRHCEEPLRRSNPRWLRGGRMDCSQRRDEIATIRPKRLYSNPGCIPPRKSHGCHHAIVVNRTGPLADSQTSAEIRLLSSLPDVALRSEFSTCSFCSGITCSIPTCAS